MTVMIVDNDLWVLSGIKHLLESSDLGLEISCFDNAKEAISFAQDKRPSIVIADVEMPGCNGLDMCNLLKEIYEPTLVIISGYDRFQYAQQAITLGVVHYVLKPIQQTKFLNIIKEIIQDKISEEHSRFKQNEIMKAKFFLDIASGRLDSIAVKEYIGLIDERIASEGISLCLLHIENHALLINMMNKQGSISSHTYPAILTKSLGKCPDSASYYEITNGYFLFIVFGSGHSFVEWMESVLFIAEKNNCIASAGLSQQTHDSHKIGELYEQTVKALKLEFFHNSGKIYQYNHKDNSLLSQKNDLMCLHDHATRITQAISSRASYSPPDDAIEELFRAIRDLQYNQAEAVIFCQELLLLISMEFMHILERKPTFSHSMYDESLKSSRTLLDLRRRFEDCIEDLYKHIHEKLKNKSDSIKLVVDTMLQEDCGSACLDTVADKLNVHPTYLSILFKEAVGVNFKTYIMDYKINTAKQMLAFSEAPVYMISEKLGYMDPTYFSKIFKKMVGVTPGEYRHSHT